MTFTRPTDRRAEWLGEVPASWEFVPATWLFSESIERARPDAPHLSATQKYGVIPLEQFEQLEGRRLTKTLKHVELRKRVEPGDFVISMRSFQGGIERVRVPGSVRSSYVVLRPSPAVHGGFFSYLFKSSAYIQGLQSTGTFIRDGQDLNYSNFRRLKLPRLDLPVQRRLSDYLDRVTARIDVLVSKKTRFIQLLREKRQALITHAVTKGLDTLSPVKDSGVEWVGKVPAHWEIGATRRFFVFNPSKQELSGRSRAQEVSFLPMEAIGETGVLDLTRTRAISEMETGYSYFANGDVVIAKITPCFENGKGAAINNLVGDVGFGTTELIVLRPSRSVSQQFAWWLFNAEGFRRYAEGHMEGSAGQKRVQDDWLKSQKVAIPPREEQVQIVKHLDRAVDRIDILVAKTQRSIDLLREHRTSLITAAVTGKIDLRGVAQRTA